MWSRQRHLHGRGARGADLQRVDLEAAPAEHHLVADGGGDLDELLAQADRPAAHRDVLRGEGAVVDVLGEAFPQLDVAVVGVAVDGVGRGLAIAARTLGSGPSTVSLLAILMAPGTVLPGV